LPEPAGVKVMPRDHLSNQPPGDILDWLTCLDGYALNLGAGGTSIKLDNCVELEHAIFRNTDVVADAHSLPFANDVFDAVVTFNTFEHLSDPVQAAREVCRVLKPGGKVILHTAFLQPVHEAPHHYYNTTEYGLRRWFKSFTITQLEVSDNFNPAYVLAWLSSEILRAVEASLGAGAAQQLADSPLRFWRSTWENPALRMNPSWDILRTLPQEIQKRFSAGFHMEATKPPSLPEEQAGAYDG
jgi:SAM-dependent methyltransferase